jgi:hypothetical protein
MAGGHIVAKRNRLALKTIAYLHAIREYPILFTAAGNLGYDDAVLVADSFLEACKGTTDPGDAYMK